jgi:hypothetical protein
MSGTTNDKRPCLLSLGIFAWNEERAIGATLDWLFQQSLFRELSQRQDSCEILCVTNGCTDATPETVTLIFQEQASWHPYAHCFQARVVPIQARGKINAWNQFVHRFSSRESRFLCMMDADILIHCPTTLWNLVRTLENDGEASVAVDRPCKDVSRKLHKGIRDWLSDAASRMTTSAEAQLCGQLYCIRSEVARNIYLPRELSACEDGILKTLVCTDNLAHPVWARRIQVAEKAEHTFEAYTSPMAILRNQKRQVIGQTMVHVLVDQEFAKWPEKDQQQLARIVRQREESDPDWFRREVSRHVRETRFFWRLHPGLIGQRWKRLRNFKLLKRLLFAPAAAVASAATLVASYLAWRTLKAGGFNYWPKAPRMGLERPLPGAASAFSRVVRASGPG